MTHPIISDLEKRHTAKHYDAAKRISDHDLNVIYEAMRLSPSSINSQPWKFIVIESDKLSNVFMTALQICFSLIKSTQKQHRILCFLLTKLTIPVMITHTL